MKNLHNNVKQTLQFCGYNCQLVENSNEPQPWEVRVSGVTEEELKEIIERVWQMYRNNRINIVMAPKVYKIKGEAGHLFNMESHDIATDLKKWAMYHGYSPADYTYEEAPAGSKGKTFNF